MTQNNTHKDCFANKISEELLNIEISIKYLNKEA